LNEQARLPLTDRDRSLDEVIADFARRVCPGGPYGEIDEWSVYDESFRRLVAWAGETDRFFEGLQPLKEGGREHDLTHDPVTGTWERMKVSLSPSTPSPCASTSGQDGF
jgi:hypothetical protein